MKISYNWLNNYNPASRPAEELSTILTSIGLEVENLEKYESVKGGLKGLIVGEVVECIPHPNADKLKLTRVNTGSAELLEIVCGAPNVARGQKVIVAPVGTVIYPFHGEPITMKVAKIRGVESQGMICAEDEIGLSEHHEGIVILPAETKVGLSLNAFYRPYEDYIFEIGLTPNHMDAMSHLGVVREICAYLSHHDQKEYSVNYPYAASFSPDSNRLPISVSIEDRACGRYSGVSTSGIQIKESPDWMQAKLKAIGVRPINNIVDITNFVLHETGQPLHAFDASKIKGGKIVVKRLPGGTKFITLDGKERILQSEDLMICNADEGMCIAGVFGGLNSGVDQNTKDIFLESAWFDPTGIRKTSFHHDLRTDAAIHFEKGMDISGTVRSLQRAALLIKELAGGEISSSIIDNYPHPAPKANVGISYSYLKKISGKSYDPSKVKKILTSLGFDISGETGDELTVAVPFHKPDINLPADLAEEIMRIDGYNNIEIPSAILISPSVEKDRLQQVYSEKISGWLVGLGFNEIFTNSITNSAYFTEQELEHSVKMINNLSSELNILRPSLLESGLESLAYNLNRKLQNLRFYEFGKSYWSRGIGQYEEKNHLCLYITGNLHDDYWKEKAKGADYYYLKGICANIFQLLNLGPVHTEPESGKKLVHGFRGLLGKQPVMEAGIVHPSLLRQFDIKQTVLYADFYWDLLVEAATRQKIEFRELPRQLPVYRDLAMVVKKSMPFEELERIINFNRPEKLREFHLFDIFESDKLGSDKKSMAINFTFLDEEKTMTDKEIDAMMDSISKNLIEKIGAEIRK